MVAIGGINKENCMRVLENGADSFAAIYAVVCSDYVKKETREFIGFFGNKKYR